jgi:putative protease
VGKVTNYFSKLNVAEILIETNQLSVSDEILIIGPTTGVYEDLLNEVRVNLNPVQTAEKGDLCSIPVSDTVRKNDKVYKWITEVDHF